MPKSAETPVTFATPEVMSRIREVIQITSVPSWVPSVPVNFGHPGVGTLKADQWRFLSTIYLPLALISVWNGCESRHSQLNDSEGVTGLLRILDHTMHLVQAILLGCSDSMSEDKATSYLNHMKHYLDDLPVVHPGKQARPNHHMALHLPRFFRFYGPARSWWSFPFERMNGHLQRTLTNHKPGKS
jgi:hypothetical protein